MHAYPKPLLTLITHLKKLPGVGQKTAERFAFRLLDWSQDDVEKFSVSIESIKKSLPICDECGCLYDTKCRFCGASRDASVMCLIASPKDAYAIDETGAFQGVYHVLGSLLSPIDGLMPDRLDVERLMRRIERIGTREVIMALDSTLEGDATALYIKKMLDRADVTVSRLASGLPIGSSLELIDEGTLSQALAGRQLLQ